MMASSHVFRSRSRRVVGHRDPPSTVRDEHVPRPVPWPRQRLRARLLFSDGRHGASGQGRTWNVYVVNI